MSKANKRDAVGDDTGQELFYRQWPADIDGAIEEGVWEEQTPAVWDNTDPENPVLITPAVFGFTTSTRPLTQPERDLWLAEEAEDALDAKAAAAKDAVATLRAWQSDAESTTVTTANVETVLQTVVDRLGVLMGRLADKIEGDR